LAAGLAFGLRGVKMGKKGDLTGPGSLGGIILAVVVGFLLLVFVGYQLVSVIFSTSDRRLADLVC